MPTAKTWDKHEIKAAIGRRRQTLTGLADLYGLSRSAIGATLTSRSKPITAADQAISHFLGVPLHQLWPDRYDDRGHRLTKLKPLRKVPDLTSWPPEPAPDQQAA
ncbi:MAG: helix-turn-helix domain-containing protein [Hyphomicrobium sp.]